MIQERHSLSVDQRRALLYVARHAAEAALGAAGERPAPVAQMRGSFGGAFVTLWRGPALRGCIGRFADVEDAVALVAEVGRSVVRDSRFERAAVTLKELRRLNVEVSVLTTPVRIQDAAAIVIGRHGIIVRNGEHSGCFLPKVASDHGWSVEEFLAQCCREKAGLDPDAWRLPDTQVLTFTAEAFCEADVS